MGDASSMSDNIAWFEERREALFKSYGPCWLIVVDRAVQGYSTKFDEAARWADKHHPAELSRAAVLIRHTVETKHTVPAIVISGDTTLATKEAEASALKRRVDELEGLLKPFANAADHYKHDHFAATVMHRSAFAGKEDWRPAVTVLDLRNAHAALHSTPSDIEGR